MNTKKFRSCASLPAGFVPPEMLSELDASTPILVGFSGGADSGALLHLLCEYSKVSGSKIYAAHVNHQIRGEEAMRDENFCRASAEKLGIQLFVLRADVPALARERGESIELCARNVRYEFFSKLMKEHGIPILATAHNANDNLETLIFNLSRGSGLHGLCGIPPKRSCDGGILVRPILNMSRDDILEYCRKNQIEYVTDSTNTDTDYTRNKIRAQVIPILKSISPAPEKKASATSSLLRCDDDFISEFSDNIFKSAVKNGNSLSLCEASKLHKAVLSRVLIRLYDENAPKSAPALELIHVENMIKLCEKGVAHSAIDLPSGMTASIENGFVQIDTKKIREALSAVDYEIKAEYGANPISQINAEIIIGNTQTEKNVYKKSIQFSVRSDKIKGSLTLRPRKEGDRILMGGMHKSIKKLMCDRKIPLDERCRIPIICDGNDIVAVPFIGVSDVYSAKKEKSRDDIMTVTFYLF